LAALLVQTSFIGDVILSTPLLAELARRGAVDVVATPAGAAVLSGNPHVRRLIVYDKRGADRGLAALKRVASEVRDQGGGVAYLAQGSLRSAMLARMAGFKERVGFETSPGRYLYTQRVPFRRDKHHSERLLILALGAHASVPREQLRPQLYPSETDRSAADNMLRSTAHDSRPLVALAPGSVWATKRWPYYAELAAQLRHSVRIVVIGSSDDSALAAEITRATDGDVIDATGRLTLLGSASLLQRCRAIVTNDSAPLHLASAMNTPTIAVFGPTVPAFGFGPLAEESAIAEHMGLDCRPCHPHGPPKCPLGHWLCMRELSVNDVLARLTTLL
jgi:heptosyltransferase-2